MSLQARYSFYTKLYKKYSPDLSDEEIGQEVRNLSHAENQQESIDNFYKNVVGKPVTTKQRIRISEFVDPSGVKGVIDTANKDIDSQNAKIKADNEAKIKAEKLKKEEELTAKTKELDEAIKKAESKIKPFGGDYVAPDLTGKSYEEKYEYFKSIGTDEFIKNFDSKLTDELDEGLGFWSELISTQSLSKAKTKLRDLQDNNLKERAILEKIKENPNYVDDTNLEVLKAKKEIKLKQKETVKDSEIYNQYEEQLKKLDKEFVSLTNVSKEVQVEDFKDFYDEVVGTGPQLGQDGTGTSLFGNSNVDNFPTYEEYISKYGGTADTYTMLEDLNNINKDAEIAKKLYSEYKYELDEEKRNELFSENKEEIQRLANENDIDYDTLKNYITLGNFGSDVGAEEIGNLFNDRRDLVDDRYDKFMKSQGFARDGWLDDEYIKTVYGDEDPELLKKIQGKDVSVGISEIGIEHYKKFLPLDYLDNIKNVRTGSNEVTYETLEDGSLIATTENDQVEFKKKQELVDEVDSAMQEAMMKDPAVMLEHETLIKAALPELEKYKKELIESGDYNLEDVDDISKIDELLMQKQHELVTEKLIQTPTFKNRTTEIGMAFGAISQELGIDFTRQQSAFTRVMDSVYDRKDFDFYNPLNWVGELVLGVGSGVEGITSAIGDSAVASVEGFMVRQYDNELESLEEGLKNGDFNEDDLVIYSYGKWYKAGKGNKLGKMLGADEDSYLNRDAGSKAGDKLKEIKNNKNYWNESIAKQMMEYARTTRRQEAAGGADFSDGINLQEAISTVGQALPHIAIAASGGIASGALYGGASTTGSAVLGYLGTATMGLQMYGDNYMSAIENNLKKKGLDKEGIRKNNPELTEQEVEKQYLANVRNNFASGVSCVCCSSSFFRKLRCRANGRRYSKSFIKIFFSSRFSC